MDYIKYFFSFVFFMLLCTSCKQKQTDLTFNRVNELLESYPDSALILLDSIPYPHKLNERQYNEYLLLKTQAKNKADKDISSDTLICQVKEYFLKEKDMEKAALSTYYCGRVQQSKNDYENAMKSYLEAQNYASQTKNAELKGLIQFFIGKLNQHKYLYNESIERYRMASGYFHLVPEKYVNEISTFGAIANCFLLLRQNDSAFYYNEKSLAIAKIHNDSIKQAIAKQNIGVAYRQINNLSKAKDFFLEAIALNKDKEGLSKLYLNLANVYNDLGEKDSTEFYIAKSIKSLSEDNSVKANMYRLLSRLEEKKHNYLKALEYHQQYTKYLSEIIDDKQNQEILEIQKKYNFEVIQNAANKHLIEKQFILVIALVLFATILIIVFLFYRKNTKNKAAVLEANQMIYQLKETANNYDTKEKSLRNTLFHQFDILKKAALLEGYLRNDEKEKSKDFIQKFNEVVYGQKSGLDWEVLYESMNELNNRFFDNLRQSIPSFDESEFRICCLAYAGLNNTEIAIIMKLSFNTIQVKKSVIRKKIGAPGHGNLIDFLNQKIIV